MADTHTTVLRPETTSYEEVRLRWQAEGDPARKIDLELELAHVLRQASPAEALQHAIEAGRRAATLSARRQMARSFEQQGLCRLHLAQLNDAEAALRAALELYRELDLRDGRARVHQWLGQTHRDRGDFVPALESFRRSATLCADGGDELRALHAGALQSIGAIQSMMGEHDQALSTMLEALRKIKTDEEPWIAGRLMNELGILYGRLRRHDKAMESFEESLAIARRLGNRMGERTTLENIGIVLEREGNFDEALAQLESARAICEELHDERSLASIDINIGVVHLRKTEYDHAIPWFTRALAVLQEVGDRYNALIASINLAHCHMFLGRQRNARNVLDEALREAEQTGEKNIMLDILNALSLVHEALGEPADAVRCLRQASALRDEMFGAERSRALHELEVRFDVERVQRDRELVRARNVQLQRTLERKTNELTANALYLAQRTEFLMQLRHRIEDLRGRANASSRAALDELLELVGGHLHPEKNWDAFEAQFRQVHHRFIRTVSERFPHLTPMELKICAMLKLDLSNRDIAQLMCVSVHNIEMHRYRLRKKLGLSKGDNLSTFLMGI